MATRDFRVIFAESAFNDLAEIVDYWTDRQDRERGEQYAHDLPAEAIRLLSDPATAQTGRYLRQTAYPEVQEQPVFKRSYRILYLVRDTEQTVEVLRFWHSHRDEPFR